jgi:glycosyltransferase involved in cell wall biosynthesis
LSEYAESVYRRYSLDANKIVRIPNFSPLKIRAAAKNNLTADWIYVGRLSPEKGILELVKNWPDSEKLCIYGSGILQRQIEELIREKPNIHFMGQISREDLGKILSRAKGLIFPSTCRENSPMIYVEALSLGLPVLAYSANSVADLVRQDNSGYVFDTWIDLPTALEVLSKSRDSYSRNALAAAQIQYSPDAWYKKTLAAYQSARKSFQNLS